MKNQEGFSAYLIVFLISITVIILSGGAYYLFRNTNSTHPQPRTSSLNDSPTPTSKSSKDDTANWQAYNEGNQFTFKYPNNWIIKKQEGSTSPCGGPEFSPTDNSVNGWFTICSTDPNPGDTPETLAVRTVNGGFATKNTLVSRSNITVNGFNGVKQEYTNDIGQTFLDAYFGEFTQTVIEPENKTIQRTIPLNLFLVENDGLHKDEAKKVFDEVLSSFHFNK